MTTTQSSRRAVFRRIAQIAYREWPPIPQPHCTTGVQRVGPQKTSPLSLVSGSRTTLTDSLRKFVYHWPLSTPTSPFTTATPDKHGTTWNNWCGGFCSKNSTGGITKRLSPATSSNAALCRQLGFETVPDQSTLWRTWHRRFSTDLQETIQECARTILVQAERASVDVPRSPQRIADHPDTDEEDPLNEQARISKSISRWVPAE